MNFFAFGFRRMLPIVSGVIPFGAVMGAATSTAGLSLTKSVLMNLFVFAGAAQLASLELMTKNATILVVVVTGLIINLRFLLYSAALSPIVQNEKPWTRLLGAYFLTDQSYAVMSAHESHFRNSHEAVQFYFGSCTCMALAWHLSVLAGFLFGNFAPTDWALEFGVPLSFIVLLIPTLKRPSYYAVAVASGAFALVFHTLPYHLGLIASAAVAMGVAVLFVRRRAERSVEQ